MSTTGSDDAETMQGAFQLGYTRQQVIKSIALALVLHAAVVGAYLVLGSEKKPPQGKVAAKEEKKDGEGKDAAGAKSPDAKAETQKSGDAPPAAATGSEDTKAPAKAKGAEASKANELPTAPDSDIDAILKAK